jgi:ParB family transcriptional regulator, chromosome partitioning protein
MQFNSENNPAPIFHIEVEKIKPNPYQPRKTFEPEALNELASSIREYGVLHPIIVTKIERTSPEGTEIEYQLVSGERRLKASKIAGLERIPAIIKAAISERERLELAIIENIQRENLNPLETARAYVKLQEQFGLTQREIAVRVGKSRESVANSMRLLNLPTFAQDALSTRKINESQARILLMVHDIKEQQEVFNNLVVNNLSVRELRSIIRSKKEKLNTTEDEQSQPTLKARIDPEIAFLEEQLMEALGTKVKVQSEGEGGKLMINFYSKEELQSIIEKIAQKGINEVLQKENINLIEEQNNNPIQEKVDLIEDNQQDNQTQERIESPDNNFEKLEGLAEKTPLLGEEKLLEERVIDSDPDDLPMVIKYSDEDFVV